MLFVYGNFARKFWWNAISLKIGFDYAVIKTNQHRWEMLTFRVLSWCDFISYKYILMAALFLAALVSRLTPFVAYSGLLRRILWPISGRSYAGIWTSDLPIFAEVQTDEQAKLGWFYLLLWTSYTEESHIFIPKRCEKSQKVFLIHN